jgi:hypothetical protein
MLEYRVQFAKKLPAVACVAVKNHHDGINAVRLAMRSQNPRQPVKQGHLDGIAFLAESFGDAADPLEIVDSPGVRLALFANDLRQQRFDQPCA